jgi:hypothetical protein
LAVANAPNAFYTQPDNLFENLSETEFTTNMRFTVTGANDDNAPSWGNYFPIDQSSLVMSQRIVKAATDERLNIALDRIVARIDVSVAATGYALISASLWNAADEATIWETTTGVAHGQTGRFYGINAPKDTVGLGTKAIVGGLYALPNYVESPAQDDAVTTNLILGIAQSYDNTSDQNVDSLGDTYFSRVNLTNKNMQNLRRNMAYSVRIVGVRALGATNEKDALTQAELLVNMTVNNWNLDENGSVFMDEYGNLLAISTTNLRIEPAGGIHNIQIYTVNAGITNPALRIRTSRLPTGINCRLNGDVLEVTADSSMVERTGFIELEYGTLSGTVNVIQSGVTDQYLEITPETLPVFDGAAPTESPKISVVSSGPWTAVLYNPGFSFSLNAAKDTLTGKTGDQFVFYTADDNNAVQQRAAFILFTLDDNPEISRTLVLLQRGTGGIDVLNDTNTTTGSLEFNAFGGLTTPNFGYFNIITDPSGSYSEWEIVKSGANPDAFKVMLRDSTTVVTEGDAGTNKNVVIIPDSNRTTSSRSATIRFQLKGRPSIGRNINVTQAGQVLNFNPGASAGNIPLAGGSEFFIVTSSTTWTASIKTTDANDATNSIDSLATINRVAGATGDSIIVIFPKNSVPMIIPTATVTVKLDNTDVVKTIVVRQSQLNPRPIKVRNAFMDDYRVTALGPRAYESSYPYFFWLNQDPRPNNASGYVAGAQNGTVSMQFFGPSDAYTVYTATAMTIERGGNNVAQPIPALGTDIGIFWDNRPSSSTMLANVATWKNADKRNFYISVPCLYDSSYADDFMNIITPGGGYSYVWRTNLDQSNNTPVAARALSPANGGEKLWQYLIEDGPFGKVNIANVNYRTAYDGYGSDGYQTWNSHMIPLMLSDTGGCMLGIDPTNNIATFNAMLFSRFYLSNNWMSDTDNGRFLLNILAFITNAAQYGDDFTSMYR